MNKLGTYRIFFKSYGLVSLFKAFFFFTSDLFHVRGMASV